ncbi:MAG: acyl-CoA reductase [Saprospiraceae bacterium]
MNRTNHKKHFTNPMNANERIAALVSLGERLSQPDEFLEALMQRTQYNNAWFTIENQKLALGAIVQHFLQKDKLENWAAAYRLRPEGPGKTVGMVMAGNIPLVGFHDLVCTFVAGHKAQIKLSEKDQYLLPYLLKLLKEIAPGSEQYFEIVEKLQGFDAVIATGSNNTARYFEAYFGKYPHIIRRNRNAVAVLTGRETADELKELGKDIFRFFGLGCRNVSKLFLPTDYDFNALLETLHEYRDLVLHDKYKNNFDYNLALVMLNRTPYYNNGCVILQENPQTASRIAMVHYEYYDSEKEVHEKIAATREEIQCVVGNSEQLSLPDTGLVPFGKSQEPGLADYPDGVDVMRFMESLN